VKKTPTPPERAVELAGGQTALAEKMNATSHGKKRKVKYRQCHVWKWLQSGAIPAEHCPAVSEAVGMPLHDLNNLFPKVAA
jgi:hypothetical protein